MNNGQMFVRETNRRTDTSRQGNIVNRTTTITTEQRVGLLRTGVRTSLIFR